MSNNIVTSQNYSSLVSYIDLSTTNFSTRDRAVDRITIHHAAGEATMDKYTRILQTGRQCSWNYGIAEDGTIGLFVEESKRAWTSSSRANDMRAITMEVSNSGYSEDPGYEWPVSPEAIEAVKDLCTDICQRHGKRRLIWEPNSAVALNMVLAADEMLITVHRWFADTSCPGPTLLSKLGEIAEEVTRRLNGGVFVARPPAIVTNVTTMRVPTTSEAVLHATYGTLATPDRITTNPYIVTLPNVPIALDYTHLKSKRVSGVLIPAEYTSTVMSEHVTSADAANMPYGFVYNISSSIASVEAARSDVTTLYKIVRPHTPDLGIWLSLDFPDNRSVEVNDRILTVYMERLIEAGFRGAIGIRFTPEQLQRFNVNKFATTFALWIVSHMSNEATLGEDLTPAAFQVQSTSGAQFDASLREIGYLNAQYEPSILSSNLILSIINYRNRLEEMSQIFSESTSQDILDYLAPLHREIVKYFIDNGYNTAVGIGVLSYLYALSECRTNTVRKFSGTSVTGYGICLWTHERAAQMKAVVGNRWPGNLTGQLDFMYAELSDDIYRSVLECMRTTECTVEGALSVYNALRSQYISLTNMDSGEALVTNFYSMVVSQVV